MKSDLNNQKIKKISMFDLKNQNVDLKQSLFWINLKILTNFDIKNNILTNFGLKPNFWQFFLHEKWKIRP